MAVLSGAKQAYWDVRRGVDMWRHALVGGERAFRSVVLEDHFLRGTTALKPVRRETRE